MRVYSPYGPVGVTWYCRKYVWRMVVPAMAQQLVSELATSRGQLAIRWGRVLHRWRNSPLAMATAHGTQGKLVVVAPRLRHP